MGIRKYTGTIFKYCSIEEYEEVKPSLGKTIREFSYNSGTRKLHSFVPISRDTLKVRAYSLNFYTTSKEEKVTKKDSELDDGMWIFNVYL